MNSPSLVLKLNKKGPPPALMFAQKGALSQAWEQRIEHTSTRPNRIPFPDYIIFLYIPSNQLEKATPEKEHHLTAFGWLHRGLKLSPPSHLLRWDKLAHQTGRSRVHCWYPPFRDHLHDPIYNRHIPLKAPLLFSQHAASILMSSQINSSVSFLGCAPPA